MEEKKIFLPFIHFSITPLLHYCYGPEEFSPTDTGPPV